MEYDQPERRRKSLDHDLIIEINQRLNHIVEQFTEARNEKRQILEDHEARIRFMEKALWTGFGALIVIQFLLKLWKF